MSGLWIKRLNESDSRIHKENVLAEALAMAKLGDSMCDNFLKLASDAYNPFVTFGLKQVPESVNIDGAENPWGEFNSLLRQLSNRELTGNAAREAVESIMNRFDSVHWNELCRGVLRKDLRAGISDKTLNKVLGKTKYKVPTFSCQLATSCEDRPEMRGKKRIEPKLDGVRVLMVAERIWLNKHLTWIVTAYSRNGKVFDNFSHIEHEIIANAEFIANTVPLRMHGFVLDGEVVGESFQSLMRQARRKEDADASDTVFHVFDIIPIDAFREGHWNMQLHRRLELLNRMGAVINNMHHVQLLDHITVDLDTAEGRDQYHRYAQDMVSAGYEGVMIKDLEAPYICKRSTFWLKYKPTLTVDLTVVDVEQGTGRNENRLGALICSGVDHGRNITVNVGSGFSDEERDSFWTLQSEIIGRTVEILCDSITRNQDGDYSLRFPRFLRWRDDK